MSTQTAQAFLRLLRVLPAPPEEVFAAWTDPVAVARWMCPGTIEETKAELDVRVGGRMRIFMRGSDHEIDHVGEYVVVDPPRRLAFTWNSPETKGASLVTVVLEPQGQDETELTLTHERLPDEEAVQNHTRGWNACLALLRTHLQRASQEVPS